MNRDESRVPFAPAGHFIQTPAKSKPNMFPDKRTVAEEGDFDGRVEAERRSGSTIKTRQEEVGGRNHEGSDRAPDYRYQQFNGV